MFKHIALIAALLLLGAGSAFAEEKKLVVAHDATWPPMEYTDAKKNIVGYSVDYVDAVAKELGIEVEHKSVAWDGIFAGLAAGRYDFISSSVTITEERKKGMDFSEPYFEVRQAVLVPKTSAAKTAADLENKKIGAQLGTTGFFAIKKIKGADAKSYNEIGLAVEALYTGRIDAVICDDPVAADFALQKAEYADKLKIAFIIETAEKEYYGFAIKKGNTDLVNLLNKGIAQVKAKGIEDELRKKWIGK